VTLVRDFGMGEAPIRVFANLEPQRFTTIDRAGVE
jgi:hypothetical protein